MKNVKAPIGAETFYTSTGKISPKFVITLLSLFLS